jgi:spermidine synthase
LFAIAALIALRRSSSEAPLPKTRLDPKVRFALVAVVAILIFSLSHDYETRYSNRQVRRDYTASVIATGQGFDRRLLVNGVGMTRLTPITKYIAHLPLAFMSRPPQNGLVICFGMGTSFRSMLSWGIPTTSVDLVPSVPALFSYFHANAAKVESSPRAHIAIDDGRRFLDSSAESYDVIVVDPPLPPEAPGSSLLYSTEFYDAVKRHLRKDGILQAWYPEAGGDAATTASVTKALMQSFPYVRAFWSYDGFGIHFLASMDPIPVPTSSVLAARMPSAAASDFVEWGPDATPQQQFESVISRELKLEDLVAQDPRVPAMRDDQPINEYYLLRHWLHYYR